MHNGRSMLSNRDTYQFVIDSVGLGSLDCPLVDDSSSHGHVENVVSLVPLLASLEYSIRVHWFHVESSNWNWCSPATVNSLWFQRHSRVPEHEQWRSFHSGCIYRRSLDSVDWAKWSPSCEVQHSRCEYSNVTMDFEGDYRENDHVELVWTRSLLHGQVLRHGWPVVGSSRIYCPTEANRNDVDTRHYHDSVAFLAESHWRVFVLIPMENGWELVYLNKKSRRQMLSRWMVTQELTVLLSGFVILRSFVQENTFGRCQCTCCFVGGCFWRPCCGRCCCRRRDDLLRGMWTCTSFSGYRRFFDFMGSLHLTFDPSFRLNRFDFIDH